jgi:16S rRNA (guanine966-N2)-methyltransferase
MRIVGGELGGRRIATPPGTATRPTPERAREALFSMLGPLDDERVLDLFAGSGALGIEAISRGAREAVFVDSSPRACAVIAANLEALGVAGRGRVVRAPWRAALRAEARSGRVYGVCVADPPYALTPTIATELPEALEPVLRPGALVALEHRAGDRIADPGEGWERIRERGYGDSAIVIWRAGARP